MHSPSRFGYPKPFRNALNNLNRSECFPDLLNEELVAFAQNLVGQPLAPMPPGQQILFSLPSKEPWSVPNDLWHIDLPKLGEQASPGLQLFTFLDGVEPQGGATLVVAGSHRLSNSIAGQSSKLLKQRLKKEGYFRSLFDPSRSAIVCLEETKGQVNDVDLEIVELTGRVGDAYLMDLRVLHSLAPNSSDNARMMLTCRLPRSTIAAKYSNPA